MKRYRNLHLWMLIPMFFMQFGIFEDYWGDFSDNAWSVHVHYWTGTIWYSWLIFQPYLASHGQIARHRTLGIIGIFLAGAVCITALSMMHRDIGNAEFAMKNPERMGPFQPWFFYGVLVVEIVMMVSFGIAVIQSIIHRKKSEDHAWWLTSTVFLIMMPALGRGVQNIYVDLMRSHWPQINIMIPIYLTQVIILGLLLVFARKYGRIAHPATYLALGVNLFIFLLEPLGRSETIQHWLNMAVKG